MVQPFIVNDGSLELEILHAEGKSSSIRYKHFPLSEVTDAILGMCEMTSLDVRF